METTLRTPSSILGFTVIEILMVLTLVGILAAIGIDSLGQSSDQAKFDETVHRMEQILHAMIGDPVIREGGARTNFGFLGDIGSTPTAAQGIAGLIVNPGLPAYSVNTAARIGIGWNGPYLSSSSSGIPPGQDAWGRAFIYTPSPAPPILRSLGADGSVGGTGFSQDITYVLSNESRVGTVYGFLCETGGPFMGPNAEIELNHPDGSGAITSPTVLLVPAVKGAFNFPNVPFGVRSITAYIPNKATATPANTYGPVLFSLDQPNFVLPCARLDIAP